MEDWCVSRSSDSVVGAALEDQDPRNDDAPPAEAVGEANVPWTPPDIPTVAMDFLLFEH